MLATKSKKHAILFRNARDIDHPMAFIQSETIAMVFAKMISELP